MLPNEAIELIAKFVSSSSTLYCLLEVLPSDALTDSMGYLREIYRIIATQYFPNHWYVRPWPTLRLTENYHLDVEQLAGKCVSLFKSVIMFGESKWPELSHADNIHYSVHSDTGFNNALSNPHAQGLNLFIGKDSLQPSVFVKMSHHLSGLSNLKYIDVSWEKCQQKEFAAFIQVLPTLDALEALHIRDNAVKWTNKMVQALAKWCDQQKATQLTIDASSLDYDIFSRYFTGFTRWLIQNNQTSKTFCRNELVGILFNYVEESNFEDCLKSLELCHLKTLSIRFGCRKIEISSDRMLRLMQVIANKKSLKRLIIQSGILDLKCCEQLAEVLPQLQCLELSRNKINDESGLILLKEWQRCSRLQQLYLNEQNLANSTPSLIAKMITNGAPISNLQLRGNKIGNDGILALSSIMHRLESIDIGYNCINHEGARIIAKSIPMTSHLQYINLSCNPLTREGFLAIISQLQNSPPRLGYVQMTLYMDESELHEECYHAVQQLPNQNWCFINRRGR